MRKALYAALLFVLIAIAALLAACAQQAESDASSLPEEPAPPARLETEAQLREGLAGLEPGANALRRTYYEELLARDLFREEDYLALAALYADVGDEAARRDMLRRVLRLYPSEAYAQQLHELARECAAGSADGDALMDALRQALADGDAEAFRALVSGGDWAAAFQEAPELYATRTHYTAEGWAAQVESDAFETTVSILGADGAYLYGRVNGAGAVLAAAVYQDGAFHGEADVRWFDEADALYKSYAATLRDDICVDAIEITYDGVFYTGALGEDGAVLETQQAKTAQAGGVVYASQPGGTLYLYQPNADLETFRLDCAALGLPRAEIWE